MAMPKFDIEKFNGENNFSLWKIKMKAILTNQGVVEALSKETLEAMTDRIKARDIMLRAHSTLLLSLSDEVLREIADEPTALDVWEKLDKVYLGKSLANRLILKKQLYTLTMEETKDIRKHLDDFNRIILDLRSVEVKIEDEDQAILLLSSLHKGYEHIVDTMLYGKETLSMNEVKSVLMSKEIQRKGDVGREGESYVARGRSNSRGKARHGEKVSRRCFLCHKEGHFKKECPERKKWPKHGDQSEGEASYAMKKDEEGYSSSEVLVVSTNQGGKEWIMDSGSSVHVCSDKGWFTNFKEMKGAMLLGDTRPCQVLGFGKISIHSSDGCRLDLQEVRYIPDMKRNIISLGMLEASGCKVSIGKGCIKVYRRGVALIEASQRDGLYVVEGHTGFGTARVADSMDKHTHKGHMRVDYIGNKRLAEVVNQNLIIDGGSQDLKFWEQNSVAEFRDMAAVKVKGLGRHVAALGDNQEEHMKEDKGTLRQPGKQRQEDMSKRLLLGKRDKSGQILSRELGADFILA